MTRDTLVMVAVDNMEQDIFKNGLSDCSVVYGNGGYTSISVTDFSVIELKCNKLNTTSTIYLPMMYKGSNCGFVHLFMGLSFSHFVITTCHNVMAVLSINNKHRDWVDRIVDSVKDKGIIRETYEYHAASNTDN